MAGFRCVLVILGCVLLVGGCYEDRTEITLRADGSGTVRQKLVLTERVVVAVSEEGEGQSGAPAASEASIREKVGSALAIRRIQETDLPDGGRKIEFEGTFDNAEQFFLSDFCRETLDLKLVEAGEGKAAIVCETATGVGSSGGPSITQMYGLAKGLYVERTVHLPAEVGATNGTRGADKRTVTWVTDLRDTDGLARAKAFLKGEDKGVGRAEFDASALEFSLPLKTQVAAEATVAAKAAGLEAEVTWVAAQKKLTLSGDDKPEMGQVELGITLRWDEGHAPPVCKTPVLTHLRDDLGNDLVKEGFDHVYKIYDSAKEEELKLQTKAPGAGASHLVGLEGYVPVVTERKTEKVVLENPVELAGRESTGNAVLDKLNFRIKEIEGGDMDVVIGAGHRTILSVSMFRRDGSEIKSAGGSGWGESYSYSFSGDLSEAAKCEIEVVVEETVVKVPFSLERARLP